MFPVLLNGITTQQLNHDYNARLTLSNKKKKVVDILATARLVIGNAVYANNSALNVSYINHNYAAKVRVTIAKKWNLFTNFEYKIYANTGYGDAIAVPICTAGINRTFLKNRIFLPISFLKLLNIPCAITLRSSILSPGTLFPNNWNS